MIDDHQLLCQYLLHFVFFKCVAILSTKMQNINLLEFIFKPFGTTNTTTTNHSRIAKMTDWYDRFGRSASRDVWRDNGVPVAAQTVGGP